MFFVDYVRNMQHLRKIISIVFYHLGHNVDRLLWMISPTNEWVGDKLADLYQWAMWKSVEYDDNYEVWKYQNISSDE